MACWEKSADRTMKIERRKPLNADIGILGVGHKTYWKQFDGLLGEMHKKMDAFVKKVKSQGVNTINFGISDCAETAYDLLPKIKSADIDILFIDMLTYATSSSAGIILKELNVPIVLVALQPLHVLDYKRASTYMQLCNDDVCSIPEFTGVATRMGKPVPDIIIGTLENDIFADAEIKKWCKIAKVLHDLKKARLGLLGHVLESMLDMHTDPTAVTSAFGCHVVMCEPDDILKHYESLNAKMPEVERKKGEILAFFDTPEPVSDPITEKLTEDDLNTAALTAVALEHFIKERRLDGLAYYYESDEFGIMRKLITNLTVGNSMLTSAGFPMCGEFDIKTCIAMLMMDRLDIGGSFAEFHPIDFERDSILVGHDGPHHLNIADRKPVLRSLKKYHGKPGSGAGVEFCIKEGPITLLSIGSTANGKFKMVLAEGESVHGPVPPTGNTNTHGSFKPDVRTFLKKWCAEGPTHHFALGVGHYSEILKKIGELLGIEAVIINNSKSNEKS